MITNGLKTLISSTSIKKIFVNRMRQMVPSFLFCLQNMMLSTLLILAVYRTRVIYELRDGPCSPSSLRAQ